MNNNLELNKVENIQPDSKLEVITSRKLLSKVSGGNGNASKHVATFSGGCDSESCETKWDN